MVRIRRAFGDTLISVAALITLITVLAAFDGRVREQISLRIGSGQSAANSVSGAGVVVRDLTAVVVDAVHDQTIEHAPMVIFVLAATVLLLFMLRT
jgi:hypothetical protein